MRRVCNEIQFATFQPDAVKMLAGLFDDVWAGAAPDFGAEPNTIEMGRMRLATIILELARDGQLGPDQITRTADRLIRQARRLEGSSDQRATR